MFSQILNSIKEISGFGHLTRHTMQAQAVSVFEQDETPYELSQNSISSSKFIKFSPYSEYNEFALVFENGSGEDISKITFGNFNKPDINKFDLSPFKTEYNKDLFTNQGYIAHVIVKEPLSSFSKSSYKDTLQEVENLLAKFEVE